MSPNTFEQRTFGTTACTYPEMQRTKKRSEHATDLFVWTFRKAIINSECNTLARLCLSSNELKRNIARQTHRRRSRSALRVASVSVLIKDVNVNANSCVCVCSGFVLESLILIFSYFLCVYVCDAVRLHSALEFNQVCVPCFRGHRMSVHGFAICINYFCSRCCPNRWRCSP